MSDACLASTLDNLPQSVNSFVGRAREIADVRQLLGVCRLLTLTGAGGIGKTRLGQEVAAGLVGAYEHGVWLVELAALTDASLVPREVAAALGVREADGSAPLGSVIDALADRRLLLILDNCEHLLQACADLVTQLLRACPRLQILSTSREPLGVAGETTYRVPPLSVAEAQQPGSSEAVRLFVERASANLPYYVLDDHLEAVQTICERLDGIPLAIELAAARVGVLTPEQIAARLDDRFHLLTGGSRTALPRYRTLRALIDWSHDLLDARERTLWRRLAIFAGGWTLDAAEAICPDDDDRTDAIRPDEILDLLSGLVAKSIVQADVRSGEIRYSFLESLRAYAAERLQEAGEADWLGRRHRDWYVALAERAGRHLNGPDAIPWLDRLEHERENLRLAVGWSIERGDTESGLRLAGALCRFWLVRGPYAETRAILRQMLAMPAQEQADQSVSPARPAALWTAGWLAMRQDDRDAARTYFQEALTLCQQQGNRRGEAIVRYLLGLVARVHGDYAAARREYADAQAHFAALGEDSWLAHIGLELGIMAFYQGNLSEARQHHTASLAIFQARGHELGSMWARNELGEVALAEGALDEARGHLCASLVMARRADDKERIAMNLAALAGLAAAERQPERALRLVGAAIALNELTGQLNSPAWHAMLDRWMRPARRALTAEMAAAALAAGRAMPLARAVEQALEAADPAAVLPDADVADTDVPATDALPSRGESARPGGPTLSVVRGCDQSCSAAPVVTPVKGVSGLLTRRELEVAALVARGLTNRQIAAELVITEGTAANHVKHILARLGVDSRVQVAAWAVEHGVHRSASA